MVDDVNCKGAVMIAAAGNDHGSAVWAPASDPDVLAVTAMGRTGAFPAGALAESHVGLPSTSDPSDFFAAFSNLGNDVDLVSPGVGVVSTFPPAGLAAMDGTSQATAVATAVAARKLGAYPAILALPRDIHRSISIRNLLLSHSTTTAGFPPTHEGYGRLI
jgi:subtilisin